MRNLVVVVPSKPKSKSKWWLLTNLSIAEGFSANMDFSGCYCNTLFIEALKRFNFSCPHNEIAYYDRRISWRACFDTALHGVIHVRRSSGIRSKQSPEKKISSRKYCHVVIALLCVVSPPFLQSLKCSGVLAGHTWETKSSNVVSSLLLLCVASAVIPASIYSGMHSFQELGDAAKWPRRLPPSKNRLRGCVSENDFKEQNGLIFRYTLFKTLVLVGNYRSHINSWRGPNSIFSTQDHCLKHLFHRLPRTELSIYQPIQYNR